ncbi:MAG TPA: hypothetical protein VMH87_18480, partial [Pseudomonadales bacterium]|nr:hypothetical protein [Pseudomonadales bacterium]
NQKTYGEIKGMTDMNGIFSASHTDSSWDLAITAKKTGYYTTRIGHELYVPGQFDASKVAANRNTTMTFLLKKIEKPIPMQAKSLNTHVPDLDKHVGYDLMLGDWVSPYGKGVNADINFMGHFDKRDGGESDFTLTVTFPKSSDGIQEFTVPDTEKGSGLRSPHEAPTEGYQSQWVQFDNRKPRRPIKTNRDPHHNYFFRVRTVADDKGNIVSAHYGKIYGDFMEFKYYFNPTPNDRNVEFDPTKNLIKNLKPLEEVKEP